VRLLKRAASYGEVERVLVHPAIKKAICEATAGDADRGWLAKMRPIWGHYYHFHIRIACPPGSVGCAAQAAVPGDDGCGKELADWYKLLTAPPRPSVPEVPKPPLTLEQLPAECRVVLNAKK
jgi:penicillin-insensitive murein DD-endopeptidase